MPTKTKIKLYFGIYQLKEEDSLKAQIVSLTREIDALKVKGVVDNKQVYQSEIHEKCKICNDIRHPTKDCPILRSMMGMYEERCGAISNYNKPYSPYFETYNPTWRNHPKFSWKNETHSSSQSQMPQRIFSQSLPTPHESLSHPSNSLENTIHAFIEAQSKTNQKHDTLLIELAEENKELKSHISKLTSSLTINEKGKFSSQTQNPQGQHMAQCSKKNNSHLEQANAITTRFGG